MQHNRFEDIKHTPLRVYNRVATAFNLREDFGEDTTKEYLESFDDDERKQMFMMTKLIEIRGKEEMHKLVTKGVEFEYDAGDEQDAA